MKCDFPGCKRKGKPEPDTRVNYCSEHSKEFNEVVGADLEDKENFKKLAKFTLKTTVNRIRNSDEAINNLAAGLNFITHLAKKAKTKGARDI